MKQIRMGIIGLGAQGKNYVKILRGEALIPGVAGYDLSERLVLTAVCNRSERALEEYRDDPRLRLFTDWREMIDSGVCDAVVVTVPHRLHCEITVYALEHGIHVLCEKPSSVKASETRRMIEVSRAHPEATFAVMFNQRTNPVYRAVHDRILSGELGQLRRFQWISNTFWRPDSYYSSAAWRGTWKGEGGGILVNTAPHQFDLWTWLCGVPRRVYAVCREGAYRNIEVENDVTITVEYDGGATGTYIASTHDPLGTDRMELDFSRGKIVVENGSCAFISIFREDESVWNRNLDYQSYMMNFSRHPEEFYRTEEITGSLPYGVEHAKLFENFAGHILYNEPLLSPGAEALRAVRLSNAAQLSGWKKLPVSFPCDEDEYEAELQKRIDSTEPAAKPVGVRNIGHISLQTANMKPMLAFYCDVLGMEKLFTQRFGDLYRKLQRDFGTSPSEEQTRQLASLQNIQDLPWVEYLKFADRQYLELFYGESRITDRIENRRDYCGYQKMAFEVPDICILREKLVDAGIALQKDITPTSDGSLEISVFDPDGNEVQFVQYSENILARLGIAALPAPRSGTPLLRTTQVAFQMKNCAEMLRFYTEGLGLRKAVSKTFAELHDTLLQTVEGKAEPSRFASLEPLRDLPWIEFMEAAPHQYIELFYPDGSEKKTAPDLTSVEGYQHLCLEVSDIQRAWEAVSANGLTPESPIRFGADGSLQFWLTDPDGNHIELMQYLPKSKQLW